VFEEDGALDRLEAFAALNGAAFYGLPATSETVRLVRGAEPVATPAPVPAGADTITVFDPGFPLHWRVASVN